MAPEEVPGKTDRLSDADTARLITDYLADAPGTADHFATLLTRHIRQVIHAFLKSHETETEDLVQESVLSVMGYIRRRGGFEGNLIHFTNTVARNRCRNHLVWKKRHRWLPVEVFEPYLAGKVDSPLDQILGREVLELLQRALDQLDAPCRDLLRALYLEKVSVEVIRRREGLKSVQSIYYRRVQCLGKAGRFLKEKLLDCSSNRGVRE